MKLDQAQFQHYRKLRRTPGEQTESSSVREYVQAAVKQFEYEDDNPYTRHGPLYTVPDEFEVPGTGYRRQWVSAQWALRYARSMYRDAEQDNKLYVKIWLRMIDEASERACGTVGRDHIGCRVEPQIPTLKQRDFRHLSKLTLQLVHIADDGRYVCECTANTAFWQKPMRIRKNALVGARYTFARIIPASYPVKTFQPAHVIEPNIPKNRRASDARRALVEYARQNGLRAFLKGSWVWVSGDTRPHKDTLKAMGARWSGRRQSWYVEGPRPVGRRNFPYRTIVQERKAA